MNKNILITGGAGFIGSNLAIKLKSMGFNVTVLDNLLPQIHGDDPTNTSPLYRSILNNDIRFIKGDITDRKIWVQVLLGQNTIIHLAAETGTGQSMYEIKRYVDVNIGGTALMLDLLTNVKHSIKRIILASSRAVYGEGKYFCQKDGIVFPKSRIVSYMEKGDFECKCPNCNGSLDLLATCEESKIHPTSIYGITKFTQEQLILAVAKSLNIPSVIFRFQNVYGPGQSLTNPYTGILSIFSSQIKSKNNLIIFEDGKESRDFVFIDDVVDATILGLNKLELDYEIFNVGCGRPIDVLSVANCLKSNFDSSIQIDITGNFRLGDIRHNYADLSKISQMLDYRPNYNFEIGIKKFCEWVNKQDIQKSLYSKSISELKEKGLYK